MCNDTNERDVAGASLRTELPPIMRRRDKKAESPLGATARVIRLFVLACAPIVGGWGVGAGPCSCALRLQPCLRYHLQHDGIGNENAVGVICEHDGT
jgi:hypothetical protein